MAGRREGRCRPHQIPFSMTDIQDIAFSFDPILRSTSFNLRDEPIVCSPRDAVRSFKRSKLDDLAIGPFLARKQV